MTSGEFHSVRVDKIWVDRDERQRKDLTNIDVLADSIRRLGLIHPLVIDRDFKLCAGERRFAAVKMLGYDFVMCQYLDEETDELTKLAIEFEENVKRDPLKWQWQREAVAKCHRIGKSRDPNWTQEKTGEAVGLTQGTVSKYLDITEEVVVHGNTKLLEQDKVETAYNMMQRDKQRRGDKLNFLYVNETEKSRRIINADFVEWVKTYEPPKDGPRFNFLHCDFPYGIDSHEMHQGSSVAAHGDYDDSEETYWRLLKVLCDNLNKLCTESAHIMFWFSMHHSTTLFSSSNITAISKSIRSLWFGISLTASAYCQIHNVAQGVLMKRVCSVREAIGRSSGRRLVHFLPQLIARSTCLLNPILFWTISSKCSLTRIP
jgi:ParB-like chromosome segregation protein Spo0J